MNRNQRLKSVKRYLLAANERKRRADSEVMGTRLMVAVTLVAGATVFGFVNGQAAASESQYGASVAINVNSLKEHFVILKRASLRGRFYTITNRSTRC